MSFNKEYSCSGGKTFYLTWDEAHAALIRSTRRANEMKQPDRLHVYRCEYCPGWHLGHDTKIVKSKKPFFKKKNKQKERDNG